MTLAARMLASDDFALCDGWNFGPLPGNELPVREVVECFLAEWGDGSWLDESDPSHPHEANILRLSIEKALWRLKWKPLWNTDEVLRRTAQWYRTYLDSPQQIPDFTLSQISAYQAALATQDLSLRPPAHAAVAVEATEGKSVGVNQ